MDIDKLRDILAIAGSKFDGHVTHGSLNAQIKVLQDAISAALAEEAKLSGKH